MGRATPSLNRVKREIQREFYLTKGKQNIRGSSKQVNDEGEKGQRDLAQLTCDRAGAGKSDEMRVGDEGEGGGRNGKQHTPKGEEDMRRDEERGIGGI